ncbi:MAG: DNA gyrase inhibitor YacG [Betaproteobacteria bacterium]|nr:DNA gyrase inhibitor YacG [Betaproteobacteria bacterium]
MKPPRRLVPCPTCNRPAAWDPDNRFRPFCSERCKLIDLGQWAQDRYAIPLAQELPPPPEDAPWGN